MKKLTSIFLLAAMMTTAAFAEIDPAKRIFELGVDADVVATENILSINDIFQETIVFDLTKIYNDMGRDGFVVRAAATPDVYTKVRIGGFGAGIDVNVDFSGSVGIGKDFFKLLAEGNTVGEEISTTLSANLQSFVTVSAPVYFRVGKLRFSATPSVFAPLVYLPTPNAKFTALVNDDGTMSAVANADIALCSVVDLGCLFAEDGSFTGDFSAITDNLGGLASEIGHSLGFDLAATAEYPLFDFLDVGAYASIPLVPGRTKYKVKGTVTASAELDEALLDKLLSKSSEEGESAESGESSESGEGSESGSSGSSEGSTESGEGSESGGEEEKFYTVDYNLSALEEKETINRPLRFGVRAAWRPINTKLLKIALKPSLGFAARNPFGSDFGWKSMYMEYDLYADLTLAYIFNMSLSSAYINQVFRQSVGFAFNFRVFELDVGVSSSNTDFLKSFALYGAEAKVGVKLGF